MILVVAGLAACFACGSNADDTAFTEPDALPGLSLSELTIDSIASAPLFEGSGQARKVPVAIQGQGMTTGTFVEALRGGEPLTLSELVRSRDGTMLAFAVRVPVDESCSGCDDDCPPVQITVRRGDFSASATLPITYLPELVVPCGDEACPDSVDLSTLPPVCDDGEPGLQPLYSRVEIKGRTGAAPLEISDGGGPVLLRAVAGLTIFRTLDISGGDALASLPGAGRAGGCDGGAGGPGDQGTVIQTRGAPSCGLEGGGGGIPAPEGAFNPGGGGGGGYLEGLPGYVDGAAKSRGGIAAVDPTLQTISPSGGGGGGSGNGSLVGGGGGGGGGHLSLISEASVTALQQLFTPTIDARGGDGAPGEVTNNDPCTGPSDQAGSGGGGGGGTVYIRARTVVTLFGFLVWTAEGAGGASGCLGFGGRGGPGAVRVDADNSAVLRTDRSRLVGPSWPGSLPTVAFDPEIISPFFGAASTTYRIEVNGVTRSEATALSDGTGQAVVPLDAGLNEVCLRASGTSDDPKSSDCLSVVYVPDAPR